MKDDAAWSQQVFGECDLGDIRRTRRLVDVGARLAHQMGRSLARCCEGEPAALLGSYRLMRNDAVSAQAIREGALGQTVHEAQSCPGALLAIEDTTSVSYAHEVAEQLGTTSNAAKAKQRGYLVHSVLMLEASSERTLGLIEQRHWCRDDAAHGQKHARKQRPYATKESYKWEQASAQMAERLGEAISRTVSVCDRESDIYEYLSYKLRHDQRFVVRASSDRRLQEREQTLIPTLEREATTWGDTTVAIAQRGGRRGREAKVTLRSLKVALQAPASHPNGHALNVNAVLVEERDPPAGETALRWVLLTTEPVDGIELIQRVVRWYELRWRIEEYHKAWKSGVGVERQRFQQGDHLERMLVITAFVAVRLLQLREAMAASSREEQAVTCETVLSTEAWQVLWLSRESGPLPPVPPSLRWAAQAIARLGGFADTKRTGRPGWEALWHGWARLQERMEGYLLAKQIATKM